MRAHLGGWVVIVMLGLASSPWVPDTEATPPACPDDPHPCGGEWPAGAPTSFHLAQRIHLPVMAHDGVVLDGYVWLPNRTDVAQVPVVLTTTPYPGQCLPASGFVGTPSCMWRIPADGFTTSRFWIDHRYETLIENGYAVAIYSVRGTGASGGCFELLGMNERQDQATLVRALANQSWANGRVGMWGLSYMGTTPWLAAVQAPDALKTIVVAGSVPDFYRAVTTPQGASLTLVGPWYAAYTTGLGVAPPAGAWVPEMQAWAEGRTNDACAETATRAFTPLGGHVFDDRDGDFFEPRRPALDVNKVEAATWVIHGFDEARAHTFQVDDIWDRLSTDTPKRFTLGHWGHTIQFDEGLANHPDGGNFTLQLLDWFAYWLKGVGTTPTLDRVDHAFPDGTWHVSDEWPASGTPTRSLYLVAGSLTDARSDGTASFRSVPVGERAPGCDASSVTGQTTSTAFLSTAFGSPVRLAGRPVLDLLLSSDQPGGSVAADLYAMAPGYDCGETEPGTAGRPVGLRHLATGAADLRHHEDTYAGIDFPIDTPTRVRIDLTAISTQLAADERIGITLTARGWWGTEALPYAPWVTVHSATTGPTSVLELPVYASD